MPDWLARALALHSEPAGPVASPENGWTCLSDSSEITEKGLFGDNDHFGALGPSISEAPSPFAAGLVGEWQRALSGLHRERPPCPLFRHWPEVLRTAERFLQDHGEAAVRLGWTDLDLFGVHRLVGTIRVDCSGALMVSGGSPVVEITAELVRFESGLAYRRAPWPPDDLVIPVWRFGA